jgi:aromatic ring-opening dioxygenase catalytic subunit (LigB family)
MLVIGSGAFTHDLRRMRRQDRKPEAVEPDVAEFAAWMWESPAADRTDGPSRRLPASANCNSGMPRRDPLALGGAA